MSFYSVSLFATSMGSFLLAIFVYLKGKDKLPNVTLGLFSMSLGWWCFGQFMGEVVASKEQVLFWTREGIAGGIFIPVFFVHFVLALLDKTVREKLLLYIAYGLGFLFLLLDFTPFFVKDVAPASGFRYYPQPGVVYPFLAVFVLACFAYGFLCLFIGAISSNGAKRNQIFYVILACIVGFLGGMTTFFPVWGINFPVVSHLALPLYVLITVYAILKHRLLDISVIVREGLVYSTLTVLFAGFYVLAVLFANYFVSHYILFNQVATIFLVVFISVMVFQPVRNGVQRLVDRLFFQGEYRYQKTIDDLSSENRKLFSDLLQANKLAALGTISGGMAHEIKNPLASIKGMTQVLHDNLDDPEFIKEYQEVVDRQVDRINNLVEKLLKFGQPPQLLLSVFDLNRAIDETIGLVASQCRKNKIRIEQKLAKLPEIQADAEQLSQVLLNLMLNAIQSMSEGGVLSITSGVKMPDNIVVEIADTGKGISPENLNNIFDPLFTTKDGGTGMGLAVVYRIVTGHDGEISVDTKLGKGTKFSICLPIKTTRSA